MSEKLLGFLSALGAAFSNPMPSLHPMDLLIGVCCGAGLRLAVYLKGNRISFAKRAETSKSGVAFPPQGRLFSIFILVPCFLQNSD